MTALDWFIEELNKNFWDRDKTTSTILKAKKMDKDKEYETKAYWFGRGILAGRENKIEELSPKKD